MLITAPLIHNGFEFLPAGSVLEVNNDGTVVTIHESIGQDPVVSYEGIICPGFVNVHCHIELSHLKGVMPEHSGLIPFLQKIPSYRTQFSDEAIKTAQLEAYISLLENGIVAVGDIANVADTLVLRLADKLHIHSFVECIGFTDQFASQRLAASEKIFEGFAAQMAGEKILHQSIVPHAPYSVSESLFKLINNHQPGSIISIHNQESRAEDEYYRQKSGAIRDLLQGFGINDDFFKPSGNSSLHTYAQWLSAGHRMIFVHNTYTTKEDITFAVKKFDQAFWCMCPNANLYLEKRLPDIPIFIEEGATICIGTDSLASNHQLSILSELVTLKTHFQELEWDCLLQWATINGATALNMHERIGSFETGKQPGVINVTGLETETPSVKRII